MSYNFTVSRKKLKEDILDQGWAVKVKWIESLGISTKRTDFKQPEEDDEGNLREGLFISLRGGEILCELINLVKPNVVPKIKSPTTPFAAADNINAFLKACKIVGLKESVCFLID